MPGVHSGSQITGSWGDLGVSGLTWVQGPSQVLLHSMCSELLSSLSSPKWMFLLFVYFPKTGGGGMGRDSGTPFSGDLDKKIETQIPRFLQ